MSSFGNIVTSTSNPSEVQWLMDISSEIFNTDSYLESPTFSFSHCSWSVRMFPKGASFTSYNYVSLYLRKKNSQSEIHMEFVLETALQGITLCWRPGRHTFHKNENYFGWSLFLSRHHVLQHEAMKTDGCIQVTIKVRFPPLIPPLFASGVKEDVKQDIKIIRQDFKDLLLHDTEHDLILKVQDKEFKVHQNIMRFRCPVFKLMFTHDMLERNRGVVEIPDCDPLAFKQFLFYVYTGTLETLDESVMLGLYYIADKYDMTYLKEMCCAFIKKSLSAHNVSHVIRFALYHSDLSLIVEGLQYFYSNLKLVVATTEYKSLMKDDPIYANELISKVINYKYQPKELMPKFSNKFS